MRLYKAKLGSTRVIKTFAILPIIIDGEIRWLEKCKIEQRCIEIFSESESTAWVNERFINE